MIIHMMPKRKIQRTPKGQWTITIPKDWEDILKLKPKDNFDIKYFMIIIKYQLMHPVKVLSVSW